MEIVPRKDRDLVMARLATPVTGITPLRVGSNAPKVDEELRTAGYGRTKGEWVPNRLHTATFSVKNAKGTTVGLAGKSDAAMCQGDTGGPAVREVNGRYELAAVHSRFWQAGCLGTDPKETRTGAVDTRVDDITGWIQQVRSLPKRYLTTTGDFDGDGKADIATLTDYGQSKDGRSQAALWVHTASGEGFKEPRAVWETGTGGIDSWRWDASKLTSGDFNGDGKADIGILYNYGKTDGGNKTGLWTFTSNGTGFNAPDKVWESGSGAWKSWNWESSKVTAGDFNGDGKADLAVLYGLGTNPQGRNETTLMTFTSNGKGFETPVKVWESGPVSWNWNSSKLTSGDFNGDKKADLAVLYGYGKTSDGRNETALFFTANGKNGFDEPRKVWNSLEWQNGKGSWSWDASKIAAGDFNGDGKTDIAVLYGYDKTADGRNKSALWVFPGTDNGFGDPRKIWESGPGTVESWNWNTSELSAGDFNGDGKADIGVTYDFGQGADGRNEAVLWTFTSKGDGFNEPSKVWTNKL